MNDNVVGLGLLDGGHGLFLEDGGVHEVLHALDSLVKLGHKLKGLEESLHGLSPIQVAGRDVCSGLVCGLRRVILLEHFS